MEHPALSHSLLSGWSVFPVRQALLSLVTVGIVLVLSFVASAQTTAALTVLHSFDGGTNGFFPASPLVEGTDGNFYGTTVGGLSTPSTIYRMTPSGALTTVHTFGAPSVIFRYSALTRAADGNFYGTTISDGANGYGTVFQITPAGVFKVIHDFTANDGYQGYGPLTQDSDGNFYGTNYYGGTHGYGTAYRVTPVGVLTVLVHFDKAANTAHPTSSLLRDSDGNSYCTLSVETDREFSEVVRITPAGAVVYLYTIPEGNNNGAYQASLAPGNDGYFYGTTSALSQNGAYTSLGTVFQVNPFGTFRTLYHFTAGGDGSNPLGPLVQGKDGNLYGTTHGTTLAGGDRSLGTVFEITTDGAFTLLHTFAGNDGEGANGLFQSSDGNFYGTNAYGGANNGGTIFKLTVTSHPAFFTGQASLGNGVYYLAFPDGNPFGYYSFLSDPHYLYHVDLGYEYAFDANDGKNGVYLYDFASNTFFYTSPGFPFPYLYDFSLNSVLYYYPDPDNAGRYNTDGVRYFYDFATGEVITK